MFELLAADFRPWAWWLFRWAEAEGLHPRVTSTYRSRAQQTKLYQRYLRGLSPLPAAPPGQSLHEYGYAFDMVTDDPARAGAQWRRAGGRWYENDPVHFEALR